MSSCKRVSVAGDRIVSMAREAGVRCSDVKCENLKRFLDAFTRIGYDLDFLTKTRPKYDIQEILPPLFRAMETDTPIEDPKLEDLIIALSRNGVPVPVNRNDSLLIRSGTCLVWTMQTGCYWLPNCPQRHYQIDATLKVDTER